MLLTSIIDRMESINLKIDHAIHSPGNDLQVLILGLRQDFASQCGDFLKALGEDPRSVGDRALFEELQEMLDEMRIKLAAHQRKWQSADIRHDYPAYQAASRAIYETIARFTRTARAKLDGYAPTGNEIGLEMLRIMPAKVAQDAEAEPRMPEWELPRGPRPPFR